MQFSGGDTDIFQSAFKRSSLSQINVKFSPVTGFELKFVKIYFLVKSILFSPDTNDCSSNADCVNEPGSFECNCRPGYTGNGVNCIGKFSKDRLRNSCFRYLQTSMSRPLEIDKHATSMRRHVVL